MKEDNENPALVIGVMLGEIFIIWCLLALITKLKPSNDRYTLAAVLFGFFVGAADVLAVCFAKKEGNISLDSAQMLGLPALASPIFASLALRFALPNLVECSRNKALYFSNIGTSPKETKDFITNDSSQNSVTTGDSSLSVESDSHVSESTGISLRSSLSLY